MRSKLEINNQHAKAADSAVFFWVENYDFSLDKLFVKFRISGYKYKYL